MPRSLALILVVLLAGCAEFGDQANVNGLDAASDSTPAATKAATQPKLQSAAQWRQVATDMWNGLEGDLVAQGHTGSSFALPHGGDGSEFGAALVEFMTTTMIQGGFTVDSHAPYRVTLSTNVVHNKGTTEEGYMPGADISPSGTNGLDDLIVTLTVREQGEVIGRQTRVYYIDTDHRGLYQTTVKSDESAGDSPRDAQGLVSIRIDASAVEGPRNRMEANIAASQQCAESGHSAAFVDQEFTANQRGVSTVRFRCL